MLNYFHLFQDHCIKAKHFTNSGNVLSDFTAFSI